MADTETAPKPPPNLREATDESRECGNCSYYKRGRCELPAPFDAHLPVLDEWVCDRWAKGAQVDVDEPQPGGARNLQDAEREAYVRVRAHIRGRRKAPGAPATASYQ